MRSLKRQAQRAFTKRAASDGQLCDFSEEQKSFTACGLHIVHIPDMLLGRFLDLCFAQRNQQASGVELQSCLMEEQYCLQEMRGLDPAATNGLCMASTWPCLLSLIETVWMHVEHDSNRRNRLYLSKSSAFPPCTQHVTSSPDDAMQAMRFQCTGRSADICQDRKGAYLGILGIYEDLDNVSNLAFSSRRNARQGIMCSSRYVCQPAYSNIFNA